MKIEIKLIPDSRRYYRADNPWNTLILCCKNFTSIFLDDLSFLPDEKNAVLIIGDEYFDGSIRMYKRRAYAYLMEAMNINNVHEHFTKLDGSYRIVITGYMCRLLKYHGIQDDVPYYVKVEYA